MTASSVIVLIILAVLAFGAAIASFIAEQLEKRRARQFVDHRVNGRRR